MARLESLNTATSLIPKSILCLRHYSARQFVSDLVAGVTVGLVALPLAMAFAISSGVAPQYGLYTAIVAGFIVSALGGSRVQVAGPTGAFVVVIYGIIAKYGLDGLYMCTLMAGAMLFLLGITGLGSAVKYIPRPVVIGFTNGIAVLIASTQIKDFFGLSIDKIPGQFLPRMAALAEHWRTFSTPAFSISVVVVAIILLTRRFFPRIPGSIIALFAMTGIAAAMHLPVETIQTRFGGIPSGMPHLIIPHFRPDLILTLLSPALTVAMLGAIESLLSAVVADRMSGDRHNPNVELVAQGIANMVTPLVGGLPATGAIARTATNIRCGAKTPVAGMIHALTLLCIIAVFAPLAGRIPMCVLAGILMVVCYNMGEWAQIPDILKQTKADIAVWLITFSLTVLADLTVAVETGMILAVLLFIHKVTATTTVSRVTLQDVEGGTPHSLQLNPIPAGAVVYRIHGPFLFGAADKLAVIEGVLETLPTVVILRLRNMTAIDATGLHAIENLADRLKESDRHLIVCGMRDQPARVMEQAEFHDHIGEKNILPTLAKAVHRAREILAAPETGPANKMA
jgi:sulfate permease, SulP family